MTSMSLHNSAEWEVMEITIPADAPIATRDDGSLSFQS